MLARAVAGRIIEALDIAPVRPTEKLQLGDPKLLKYDMSEAAEYFGVPRDTIAQRTRKDKKAKEVAFEAYG
jgi:DNA (cytosine-5)-methyltransferase 1